MYMVNFNFNLTSIWSETIVIALFQICLRFTVPVFSAYVSSIYCNALAIKHDHFDRVEFINSAFKYTAVDQIIMAIID